jgi:hypothetical protein
VYSRSESSKSERGSERASELALNICREICQPAVYVGSVAVQATATFSALQWRWQAIRAVFACAASWKAGRAAERGP